MIFLTALVISSLLVAESTSLRSASKGIKSSPSFEEAVIRSKDSHGRVLEDGTCLCADATPNTIRMLTPGGEGHHFDFFTDRWRRRIDAFYNRTGILVELIPLGSLEELNAEMFADAGKAVYDGYGFLPGIVGELTELGGLADLTEFVASSDEVDWIDNLPFERDLLAVYDGKVRSLPCDGDVHSLYYRKDLFHQYGLEPPRTWDEYTERAAFFHGMVVPDGKNGTVTLSGSCIERSRKCEQVSQQLLLQVHAATAQSKGTSQGLLFNAKTFTPNLGEAFAETLRHLENHVKYGAEEELSDGGCQYPNINNMNEGTCAQTYYWGDVYSRHLLQGSVLDGKLGVAPTPGVTKVLDPNTGKLVLCDEEICPFGKTYPDIGRVNLAPYAAGGGWSAGVAGGLPKEREKAMAQFIGFVCGKEESIKDVVTEARGTLATGADPYRKSHFDVEKWVERGYPRDATIQYINTITENLSSPNTVLDARFPSGIALMDAVVNTVYPHLVKSKTEPSTHEQRLAVAKNIEEQWMSIIQEFNRKQPEGGLPLESIYQKSLNVYNPMAPNTTSEFWSTTAIVGTSLGCSVVLILIGVLVMFYFSLQKIKEEKRLAEELAALRRLEKDDDDSDSETEDLVPQRDETEEIMKLASSQTRNILVWRILFGITFVATSCTGSILLYLSFSGTAFSISPGAATATLVSLFAASATCFVFYDRSVQARTETIVANAARANAIVTNIFPGQFRDQVIDDQENADETAALSTTGMVKIGADGQTRITSKPLADLFLETTICFADIVGFTPWSSAREPSQVFMLLESVYSAFDKIAARRRIFKVETVGDCYVAVAGLPESRRDHGLAMARFAMSILREMSKLTRNLEVSLGPDTADLTLRIGLHSGAVTAGILRGVRARVQLFGDTMNTAARIESTGVANKIHVSQECADIIFASGKETWLIKRDEKVLAKGKGLMQTYWLDMRAAARRSSNQSSGSSLGSIEDLPGGKAEDRKERLISWNVDQLVSILKLVVTRREAEMDAYKRSVVPAGTYKIVKHGASLLDDVKEIVELPEYDEKIVAKQRNPDDIAFSKNVLEELRNYVTAVCNLYQANDFHNFEHASAVVMSVLKLLSRIVSPSEEANAIGNNTAYGITSDPLTQFACAFAALIHDADHSGLSNAQLVKAKATVATIYGNRSVAEQNSLVLCWDLLMQAEYREFRETLCATQEELDRFRSLVVNSVLATDIVDKDLKALRNKRWDKAFKKDEAVAPEPERCAINRKATIVIEHLIQASDVSHTMQHWKIYRKWNERFFRECYVCYRTGRAESDPSINWYEGELGFFDYYIIPLAKKLKECGVFGKSSGEFLNYATSNRAEWAMRGQEVVAEMINAMAEETLLADASKQVTNQVANLGLPPTEPEVRSSDSEMLA